MNTIWYQAALTWYSSFDSQCCLPKVYILWNSTWLFKQWSRCKPPKKKNHKTIRKEARTPNHNPFFYGTVDEQKWSKDNQHFKKKKKRRRQKMRRCQHLNTWYSLIYWWCHSVLSWLSFSGTKKSRGLGITSSLFCGRDKKICWFAINNKKTNKYKPQFQTSKTSSSTKSHTYNRYLLGISSKNTNKKLITCLCWCVCKDSATYETTVKCLLSLYW